MNWPVIKRFFSLLFQKRGMLRFRIESVLMLTIPIEAFPDMTITWNEELDILLVDTVKLKMVLGLKTFDYTVGMVDTDWNEKTYTDIAEFVYDVRDWYDSYYDGKCTYML